MKSLLAIVISICLLAAIAPTVSATTFYNCQGTCVLNGAAVFDFPDNYFGNVTRHGSSGLTISALAKNFVNPNTAAGMNSWCNSRLPGSTGYGAKTIYQYQDNWTATTLPASNGYTVGEIGSNYQWNTTSWNGGNRTWFSLWGSCTDTGGNYTNHLFPLSSPSVSNLSLWNPTITADFSATPLNGTAPLYVAFQDTSTGGLGLLSYNWTINPPNGLIGNYTTSEYPTIVFTQNGNYTVTHCADDGKSSDCEEKTNYIWVQDATADYVTTTFWAVDPLGHRVWDSAISLQDVGNSSWTNTSSPSGGVATITSLFGHTINGYATAAGYNDGETLGITADGVSGGIILMTPTNITNVSAGYVSLYVYVKESVGNAPISGAYVNIAYEEGGSTRNDGGTTSTEGIASFVVPNDTLIYVYGEKAGYERVSTTKDSGSASGGSASVSVILYMGSQTVTPTVTATTGPGGTIPVTVDPRTPQEKESDIALILIDYGDKLVLFFIALTVIGGVKMIAK